MKSAKEMFEDLGYKIYYENELTLCYINEENDDYIYFYIHCKKIEVLHDITIYELKAINKQIEELGWLDE